MDLVQYELEVLMPMEVNGPKTIIGKSVLLHNAGDSTAQVNGNLTLSPGATIQFNFPYPGEILATKINVIFSGGTTNRLEIVTAAPVDCDYSNYKPK